jgi:hypothetical protein
MANIHAPSGPLGAATSNCSISWIPYRSKKSRAKLPITESNGF